MTSIQVRALKGFQGEPGESVRPHRYVKRGDILTVGEGRKRALVANRLVEEVAGDKSAPAPSNKMKSDLSNKGDPRAPLDEAARAEKKAKAAANRAAKKAAAQTGSPTGEAAPQSSSAPGRPLETSGNGSGSSSAETSAS